MLRSTGFFRGIECPFYTDTSEGKGVRNGCNRPYCLFRHNHGSRSNGAPAHKRKRDVHSARTEEGYDPFYPEVVSKHDNQNGEPSGGLSGELEMVNKAIEEVRYEMEREKRKLSRIGDEPYDPSQSALVSSKAIEEVRYEMEREKRKLSRIGDEPYDPSQSALVSSKDSGESRAAGSHLAYDPGSYEITTAGYNPAPGCSKYTLDSDNQKHELNSMEYVPTSVKKPSPRTPPHKLSSALSSRKYSNSTAASKTKYTLENSRPTTDMEYDPMSNYSSRITGKSKRDTRTHPVKSKSQKTHKLPETDLLDEECVAAPKKPRLPSHPVKRSVSDDLCPGTEYQPSSLINCQLRKSSGSVAETSGVERTEPTESLSNALTQRNNRDLDTQGNLKQTDKVEKKTAGNQKSHKSSGKHEKTHKSKDGVHKLSNSKMSSSSKESKTAKSSNKDSAKKENKRDPRGEDPKNTGKVETSYEVQREGRDNKRIENKIKTGEKNKPDQKKRDRDAENGARESKKYKEPSKDKDRLHKNGKLESDKRRKDEKRFSRTSSSSSTSATPKDAAKRSSSSSSSSGKRLDHKRPSLSHADLFGDESPDESSPMMDYGDDDDDDDDDAKDVPAGKSPKATKGSRLNKTAEPKSTRSSSEDESDDAVERNVFSDDNDMFNVAFIDDDLDFRSDPIEECLRIFNESNEVKLEDKGRQANQAPRNPDVTSTESTLTTLFPGQKRRVSHCVAKGNTETPSQPVAQPNKRLSAQEVCFQRMQRAQQQAAQLTATAHLDGLKQGFPGGKKRIAYLPSSKTTSSETSSADAKPDASRVLFPSQNHQIVKSQTTASILSKTSSTIKQKRVAHTPTMKSSSLKRPVIPSEFGAKVPTIIRQRYLNNFIDECVKFCPSEEAAFNMALDEEKLVYDRSSTKKIYLNIAVNTLKKLRSRGSSISLPATNSRGLVSKKKPQSHQDVLGGRLAATTSFTLNRRGKQQEEKLQGAALYRKLKSYLMTDEQLQEHGYPRLNPEAPGRAVINVTGKKATLDPFTKVCCRCGAEYKININGNCVRKEECSFHWGRLRPHKVAGGWERMYSCCSAGVGVPGCQISPQHVQDGRKESLDGYVSTFSKNLPADGNAGMFALDCEMCYTKQGLELTRVTVINSELKVIYDTFVKPDSKVVDYNTRFSGVTKEDLENTTINLRDVQAVLLNMFSAESILMGHSLESDLVALKLIHSTVVDTAIVFPHRLGLPYKRALKNLMADHLKRIIQDDVGGHDSSEDASACMELMIWKIKEDAKVKSSSAT